MAFTQIITVEGSNDQALRDLMESWDTAQSGVAPGYLGSRVLAEGSVHHIEVDFSSEEEAQRNNERSETQAWGRQLREVVSGEPTYRDLREVYTTYARN